jgi:pimeloyl-ACP methyl ester carboxylesterase
MAGSTPAIIEIPLDPNGFHAAAYQKADGATTVVVFEGTSSLEDWKTNAGMMVWKPDQFSQAESFTREAIERACGSDRTCQARISVTGHSLGGALAQHVGLRFGLRVHTFNAAGLFLPIQVELTSVNSLGFSGLHFFSQGYRLGSQYGMDIVPYLGAQFAQDSCEVPVELPAWAWDALTVELVTHQMERLSSAISLEMEARLAGTGTTVDPPATTPQVTAPPVIGAPSAGSTPPVVGPVSPPAPPAPPPAGGSVPALLAELGSLTGNARYAAFSDALANARVPARLSPQQVVDVGRGMNEYHEPYIRLIAARIVGPLTPEQVDQVAAGTQNLARMKIVTYVAGLLPGPLRPSDIDAIVRNMELFRAPTISMLAPRLAQNMGAREVISLFGTMSRPIRLATLSELKSAGRLKNPLAPEEVDAIAVTFGLLFEGAARDILQNP